MSGAWVVLFNALGSVSFGVWAFNTGSPIGWFVCGWCAAMIAAVLIIEAADRRGSKGL